MNSGAYSVVPFQYNFDNSLKFCQSLNGEIPWVNNDTEFENLILFSEEYLNSSKCQNSFWLPFKRSKDNSSKWVQQTANDSKYEFNKKDWKVKHLEDISENQDCVYFNISSREYTLSGCYR